MGRGGRTGWGWDGAGRASWVSDTCAPRLVRRLDSCVYVDEGEGNEATWVGARLSVDLNLVWAGQRDRFEMGRLEGRDAASAMIHLNLEREQPSEACICGEGESVCKQNKLSGFLRLFLE